MSSNAKEKLLSKNQKISIILGIALASMITGAIMPFYKMNDQAIASKELTENNKHSEVKAKTGINNIITSQFVPVNQINAQTKPEIEKPLIFAIPQRFQGQIIHEAKLNIKQKVVALTFDDGPDPNSTEKILKILQENKIKGTFFILGKSLQNYPEIAKKIINEGHAIGNHSWSHPYSQVTETIARQEIENTGNLLYKLTGAKTYLFRPPGGILTNGLADYAKKNKHGVVMWSADSRDWYASEEVVIDNVLKQAKSGGVILMHDGGGDRTQTIKALPKIITELKKRGYKFTTVSELLEMQDREMKNPIPPKPKPIETPSKTAPDVDDSNRWVDDLQQKGNKSLKDEKNNG